MTAEPQVPGSYSSVVDLLHISGNKAQTADRGPWSDPGGLFKLRVSPIS